MKTHIIQLDPHDDGVSVRDKMAWAKTPRILLVYPPHSHILEGKLDLRLLQRHARWLGSQLALVAPSAEVRTLAGELGIPTFATVTDAQRETWRARRRLRKLRRRASTDLRQARTRLPADGSWRARPGIRILFFALAVLAVLALAALFVPSAAVQLAPATHMQSLTIPVSAGPKTTSISLAGAIPARLVFRVVALSKTAPVTGSLVIPQTPAVGLARFRNLGTAAVTIPAGTIVLTTADPPVRFVTTRDASTPPGLNATLDVPIQALLPGQSGNLPPGTLLAIEGNLGASLSVTNPKPTAGGVDSSAPIQTAADRLHLREALLADILAECKKTLPQSLPAGSLYFPTTLAAGQVYSEAYFPADGQTGATLSLALNMQCQAQYAAAADGDALARLVLDANLPPGFEPASTPVTAALPPVPVTGPDGVTRWQVQTQRLLRARLDPQEATMLLLGRRPADAGLRLPQYLWLAGAPAIRLTPAWWPWLPFLPFRISVTIGA